VLSHSQRLASRFRSNDKRHAAASGAGSSNLLPVTGSTRLRLPMPPFCLLCTHPRPRCEHCRCLGGCGRRHEPGLCPHKWAGGHSTGCKSCETASRRKRGQRAVTALVEAVVPVMELIQSSDSTYHRLPSTCTTFGSSCTRCAFTRRTRPRCEHCRCLGGCGLRHEPGLCPHKWAGGHSTGCKSCETASRQARRSCATRNTALAVASLTAVARAAVPSPTSAATTSAPEPPETRNGPRPDPH